MDITATCYACDTASVLETTAENCAKCDNRMMVNDSCIITPECADGELLSETGVCYKCASDEPYYINGNCYSCDYDYPFSISTGQCDLCDNRVMRDSACILSSTCDVAMYQAGFDTANYTVDSNNTITYTGEMVVADAIDLSMCDLIVDGALSIETKGNLSINDITLNGGASSFYTGSLDVSYGLYNKGKLAANNINTTSKATTNSSYGVYNQGTLSGASLQAIGGSVITTGQAQSYGILNEKTITITGDITAKSGVVIGGTSAYSRGIYNLSGGEISGDSIKITADSASANTTASSIGLYNLSSSTVIATSLWAQSSETSSITYGIYNNSSTIKSNSICYAPAIYTQGTISDKTGGSAYTLTDIVNGVCNACYNDQFKANDGACYACYNANDFETTYDKCDVCDNREYDYDSAMCHVCADNLILNTAGNTCVECNATSDCAAGNCYLNECIVCENNTYWDGNSCEACFNDSHCDEICVKNACTTCLLDNDEKPYWDGDSCEACPDNSSLEIIAGNQIGQSACYCKSGYSVDGDTCAIDDSIFCIYNMKDAEAGETSSLEKVVGCPEGKYCYIYWSDDKCTVANYDAVGYLYGTCIPLSQASNTECPITIND